MRYPSPLYHSSSLVKIALVIAEIQGVMQVSVTNCDSSGFQIRSRVRVSSHGVSLSASYNSKPDPVQPPLQTLQNNKMQTQKKKERQKL